VSQRVDFSANAPFYDRRHGAVLLQDLARQLADCGELHPGSLVLDVGAGTGRVAIAFANLGYRTTALDPALQMLHRIRVKAPESPVRLVAGEGGRLPFAGKRFDAVILARILYLMADWEVVLQSVSDALKPGGCIFHEWGNGQADEVWVRVREKLRSLFRDAGVQTPFHPGARSEAEADPVLRQLGLVCTNELPIGPGPDMKLDDFVEGIAAGEFSYTWRIPKSVQDSCIPLLKKWCEETFDPAEHFPMPRELRWTIYRFP
jgi:SAM-dependent methyltransferase